eukprot:TRINITY_DN947_c0_g1_i6.p1 TRINITY_DN947_c0_g1~~TRINITY_DN947_c0_g1_i6.p1  ORF type:complete len:255 (-),score=55.56 TRINITY_DN947_c0_g1_i6:165-929(-)
MKYNQTTTLTIITTTILLLVVSCFVKFTSSEMIFKDRKEAGSVLANEFKEYQNSLDTIVVGLPRGGVVVAYPIAKKLGLPLDIVVPRKIGAPFHEEYAIGAILEDGSGYFDNDVINTYGISSEYIKQESHKQVQEAQRRLRVYRGSRGPQDFSGKRILLIDDGIATGSTMHAAITSIRNKGAKEIIVGVPVGPKDTVTNMKPLVNRFVCLSVPAGFRAVGQFYTNFDQTEDEEVLELMNDPAVCKNVESHTPAQ